MATINPTQDYDIIHTLKFASGSGVCNIRLYRGSGTAYSGTVYYRAGTSGSWTSLAVSGDSTTFPVSSTTMQIAHNWNKSGNNYMTPAFMNQFSNLKEISISQKAVLSGAIGDNFMRYYAYQSTSLEVLDVPDTSNVTSVGNYFLNSYAWNSMYLTTVGIPDTSSLMQANSFFMGSYATSTRLSLLILPRAGWFKQYSYNWGIDSSVLGKLRGYTPDPANLEEWKALTASGKTLHTNYIRDPDLVSDTPNAPPTTTLNSPSNATTLTTDTPTLAFTATDPEGDDVQYQVQVADNSSFTSPHSDHTTTTYPSGVQQSYTVSALTKGGVTYYWRVRAKDPSGSDSWGDWSATRTMTVDNNLRYLRASGNWNGSVWAFTPSGTAGSASTPTSADNVIINSNYTVTLNQNISIGTLSVTDGTFNASSYNVTVTNLLNVGVLGPAGGNLNMGSGTWTINAGEYHTSGILIYNTSSFNASNATIIFNVTGSWVDFYTANNTFRDVIINIGNPSNASHRLDISGSPTFRSLIIQSKNSAAHTVNFDDSNETGIMAEKLIVIGSSSSNKLTLHDSTQGLAWLYTGKADGTQEGTSYGKYVNMDIQTSWIVDRDNWKPYIGSTSTQGAYADNTWLTQNPPKADTLVDPLTTEPSSNPNWDVSDFPTIGRPDIVLVDYGLFGGGYVIDGGR